MKKKRAVVADVRMHLIDVGGRTAQDLGLGRIFGQTLAYVYLADGEVSLDEIEATLGLSKASISIAVRQLESFGLIQRVWKKGDRKNYYKVVDHFGIALHRGLVKMIWGKLELVSAELQSADRVLKKCDAGAGMDGLDVMKKKVAKAKDLCSTAERLLNNPILRALAKTSGS